MIDEYRLRRGGVVFNNTNSSELVGKSALFQDHAEPVVYSNHFARRTRWFIRVLRLLEHHALGELTEAVR